MRRSRTATVVLVLAFIATACGGQSLTATTGAPPPGTTKPAATKPVTTKPVVAVVRTTTTAPRTTSTAPLTTSPSSPTTSPAPRTTRPKPPATSTTVPPKAALHFDTPEAAMRYLTKAWNDYDIVALRHVTQSTARDLLLGMHKEAVNLRLNHCSLRPGGKGDYECYFDHDYPTWVPASSRQGTIGHAEFIAAPSASVGWYMFAYQGCG
jgi:hypothetical protein